MRIPHVTLAKGAFWTTAAFVVARLISFSTNVVLTRLLSPELFGVMVIVNTIRTAIELTSDIGIGQTIVYNKNADDPNFYNTAWTLKSIRGVLLWAIACALAVPLANFYKSPELKLIVPVASFVLVLSGFTSISQSFLEKRMQIGKLSAFGLTTLAIWASGQIVLAYFYPTIWALVFGLLLGSATILVGSFFLVPGLEHKFTISKMYVPQILHFGKWIFLSSTVFFLSTSFDRLYFARVIPLALLGVYGISRAISELLSTLVLRMSSVIVFPLISSHSHLSRSDLREQLTSVRLIFLLLASLCFSVSFVTADLVIRLVFDQRYHAAVWMAPVLIAGTWISILCSLNESTLLGLGKPNYAAIGFSLKFCWLLMGLPLSLSYFGIFGCLVVIAVSDVFRYTIVLFGQLRQSFSFGTQDLVVTLLMFGLVGLFEWLRWTAGLGTSAGTLPVLN